MTRSRIGTVRELKDLYSTWRKRIVSRLKEFETVHSRATDEELFAELVFCLLTPQSKAHNCWSTVEDLCSKDLLLKGGRSRLSKELNRVRFRNNKARYMIEARRTFTSKGKVSMRPMLGSFGTNQEARDWLVDNVKGLGLKEAGHFLRNIGLGQDMAILDRHILRNLVIYGVLEEVPSSMSRRRYLGIEDRMRRFSRRIGIPMAHLDLLLWCKETGEVFK